MQFYGQTFIIDNTKIVMKSLFKKTETDIKETKFDRFLQEKTENLYIIRGGELPPPEDDDDIYLD